MSEEINRKTTALAVYAAFDAWNKAPAHVKAIAGAYMGPVLEALGAINRELKSIREEAKHG